MRRGAAARGTPFFMPGGDTIPLGGEAMSTEETRHERGWRTLRSVNDEAGQRVVESLSDIAPDLARFVIEFGFGDVYARPGLRPRQRQLVTIATLAGMGGCEPQLELHIDGALNVGLSPTEIVEAIIHIAGYAGFPRALNAMAVAKRVFARRDLLPVRTDEPPQ